jgi:ribosomal protein L3 glutamine methyltransferase
MPQFTIRSLIEHAGVRLQRAHLTFGHGVADAWDEAAYIALHVMKLAPEELSPNFERTVSVRQTKRVMALVAQRIRRRIPLAYLLREARLGDYVFYVDERVIVPRSYIAELLSERLAPWLPPRRRIRRALDLCTGSGCLAIVLAETFRSAAVDAVDIDRGALAVARRNVAAYGLTRRIRLLHSDMFDAVAGERYDLILANPPYVSAATMKKLPREYRHEPVIALASGNDGLDAVRAILRDAANHLNDKGLLVVEVGHHRARVEAAFPHYALVWPQTSGGDDCVFTIDRAELLRAAASALPVPQGPARRRASQSNVLSRRR